MIHQHPIYALVLSFFLAGVVIKQCVIKGKLLKYRLILSFFLIFILAFIFAFYSDIEKNEKALLIVDYGLIGIDGIIGLTFFLSVGASMSQKTFTSEFMKSLDNNKVFILLDSKDRIKEISSLLANELMTKKEEIISKKFFDIIDNSWNVVSYNQTEINNENFREYYKDYRKKAVPNSHEKCELIVDKHNHEMIVLNLIETPIFVGNRYRGRILIGDKKSEESMLNIEKELIDKNTELESIRYKFIASLEITEEGIFFTNLDERFIWGNDNFVSNLNLNSNSISIDDYAANIHPDELTYYSRTIATLTPQNPTYEIVYRYKTGTNYKYVREVGKRIFENKKCNEILGYVSLVNNEHYERTNIKELDNIGGAEDLLARLSLLKQSNKTFELVRFRLANIKDINDNHGRQIGNMVIAEYVKLIRTKLLSDDYMYRVDGLEFACIITDCRKMDVLNKALANDEKILHIKTQFGSISLSLEINMGLVMCTDCADAQKLIEASKEALHFSQKPNVKTAYAWYKDTI